MGYDDGGYDDDEEAEEGGGSGGGEEGLEEEEEEEEEHQEGEEGEEEEEHYDCDYHHCSRSLPLPTSVLADTVSNVLVETARDPTTIIRRSASTKSVWPPNAVQAKPIATPLGASWKSLRWRGRLQVTSSDRSTAQQTSMRAPLFACFWYHPTEKKPNEYITLWTAETPLRGMWRLTWRLRGLTIPTTGSACYLFLPPSL